MELKLIKAENLATIEQYAVSLVAGILSLRSLELFHAVAMKKGLLKEDEVEVCNTLAFEFGRLIELYHAQFDNVVSRTGLTNEQILASLEQFMPPGTKIPKPKKVKNE